MNAKTYIFPLLISLFAVLVACGGSGDNGTGYSALQISQEIIGSQEGLAEMRTLAFDSEDFSEYLFGYYGLEKELLKEGVISYTGGADASEVAVFALMEDVDTGLVEDALVRYIENRIGDFYGYMPEQVYILEQAVVAVNGRYVAMLVCEEPQQAQQAFAGCFGAEAAQQQAGLEAVRFVPVQAPINERMPYEPEAILEAWRTGDHSQLNVKNKSILDVCTLVIEDVITEQMTDYEKELAIHDWIIHWAEYDAETASHAPDAKPHPDNDNPYGILVGKRAICTGYASTFQLFMDMLEIGCITIDGAARDGKNEHVWNMVWLDGAWYCVDITWNDPINLKEYNSLIQHKYFNVTSEFMRETDHQWDEKLVPEAEATTYSWNATA